MGEGEEEEDEYTVRPNDFDDFEAYFLQKSVVHAIATIRDLKNLTPPEVLAFLTNLLDSNDNSRNAYSDNYYVACLITALTYVRSESPLDYKNMVRQMERYLGKEKNMPCFHNVIAQACLHFLATLQANGHLELEINAFKPYISYGNFPSVRAVAVRCYLRIAICVAQTEASIEDTFSTIKKIMLNDPSMWFKERTAFALATALESGADLDPILNFPKANQWRKTLYQLINSEATSYSPRLRMLLLTSLRAIDGDRIAQAPKLPPRKLYPTHPMKAGGTSAAGGGGGSAEKKRQASSKQRGASSSSNSFDSHTNGAGGLSSHHTASGDYPSERPQRKAAARARIAEDPFEELLGPSSFVSSPAAAAAATAAATASSTTMAPSTSVTATTGENKPKKLIIAKLRVTPATAAASTAATATATDVAAEAATTTATLTTEAATTTRTMKSPETGASTAGTLPPSNAVILPHSAAIKTEKVVATVPQSLEPAREAVAAPSTAPTTSEAPGSTSAAAAAPKRAVFKFKPSQPATATSFAPSSEASAATPTPLPAIQAQQVAPAAATALVASAPAATNVAPTSPPIVTTDTATPATPAAPKAATAKFVFKRSTNAPAPPTATAAMDAPAAKKPKLEEAS